MESVAVRNGVKRRRKVTTKKRNPVAKANPRKRRATTTTRRKRRNPVMMAGTKMVRVQNPKRKTVRRKRRNGVTRNGVFTGIMPIFKTVALGGVGAVATRIGSNAVNSLTRGLTASLPIPQFVVNTAVEIGIAIFPVKMISEKLLTREDSGKVVAGGLISAGLTLFSGLAPGLADYNPLANGIPVIGNQWGQIGDDDSPVIATDNLAGAGEVWQ